MFNSLHYFPYLHFKWISFCRNYFFPKILSWYLHRTQYTRRRKHSSYFLCLLHELGCVCIMHDHETTYKRRKFINRSFYIKHEWTCLCFLKVFIFKSHAHSTYSSYYSIVKRCPKIPLEILFHLLFICANRYLNSLQMGLLLVAYGCRLWTFH